jgi:hypothetical protein
MSLTDRLRNASQLIDYAYRGIRNVGAGNAARTLLYKPRMSWWLRRYGEPSGPAGETTPAGAVTAVSEGAAGLLIRLEHGLCTVQAITSHMLRVRVVAGDEMPPYFSYE